MSRGLFFQKFFEGLYEDTLGVSRPTVFPPAVTRLFFSVLFELMIFTRQTGFDYHKLSPRFAGFVGFLWFFELLEMGVQIFNESRIHFGYNFSLTINSFKIV
jgi:hypothetical protein